MFRLSLKMTGRDWRAGQLRFLLVALIVAVAALSAVGFFVDRLRAGLNRDAHQLLGADLVISADQPVNAAWRAEAQKRGLILADTVTFPSMAQAGEGEQSLSQLASIKAVSPGYPQRGKLKITTNPTEAQDAVGQPTSQVPAPGTVWVDAAILSSLNAKLGDTLTLGDKAFAVTQLIASEPDRGASFLNFAPRVMLPLSDLAATALVQNGSRVSYRLLLSAPPPRRPSLRNIKSGWKARSRRRRSRVCASNRWNRAARRCNRPWTAPTVFFRSSACCRPCWRPSPWPWRRAASCCATSMPAPCCAAWA